MNKMNKKKTSSAKNDIFAELAKATNGTLLEDTDQFGYFIDTGNLALNYINSGKFIGGGIPSGITEIFGPPASSKSLLGYTLLGACQRMGGIPILFDCERAANKKFAMAAGHLDPKKIIVYEPFFIEEVESKVIEIIKKIREKNKDAPILFVWDSIGVTPCKREWRETDLPEEYSEAQFKKIVGGKEQPGERAKVAGKFLRKINPLLDENNASMFVINQIRNKIGDMWGDGETTAGGGSALPFYASCRIRASCAKTIQDATTKVPVGVNLKFKNKKGRAFSPFWEVESVPLYFETGVNPLGGLLTVMINAKRIEPSGGGGTYRVLEPWAGGKEITFKASKERNDIGSDVLLKCPSLIDAESAEQVEEYLDVFKVAIENSSSNKFVEKSGSPESDSVDNDEDYADKVDLDKLLEDN